MSTERAYSTADPAIVAAYRRAVAARKAAFDRLSADLKTLGAGPRVKAYAGTFPGSADTITAIEQQGDHIPDGWRLVRGNLEPRRGKPGEDARRWLADHQPVDVRHAMESHGLPRAAWIPRGSDLGYRVVAPRLFEHDGTLWALYDAEPGTVEFDSGKCSWTPRKLSEFHAADEAREDAAAAETAQVPA
ncbi:hypothetical protein C1I95_25725 [Micromonospora craterilacus]|uniref:Uncharacterized protein n=1 Tax=Micromonospora craterilacus TaxID=1655439 RepID=A0A2W2DQ58_9ACTN|nr:hypothetical protein [Micromonospora craterilacus]PZG12451.1 hypothetical protein C1I95_25725 [Micromonospora craterilacus]